MSVLNETRNSNIPELDNANYADEVIKINKDVFQSGEKEFAEQICNSQNIFKPNIKDYVLNAKAPKMEKEFDTCINILKEVGFNNWMNRDFCNSLPNLVEKEISNPLRKKK